MSSYRTQIHIASGSSSSVLSLVICTIKFRHEYFERNMMSHSPIKIAFNYEYN